MNAIYDRLGSTVAWRDGDDVIDLRGRMVGVIVYDGFYQTSGKFLGHFFKGCFIDAKGQTVAFIDKATVGPVKPRHLFSVPPPTLRERCNPPNTSLSPQVPLISGGWSRSSWAAYIGWDREQDRMAA